MPAHLMPSFEELYIVYFNKEGKQVAAAVGWAFLQTVHLATNAQLEAKTIVTKLKVELRLEKDMWSSISLLAVGVVNKVGEQDSKLETLACPFLKLGGYKVPQIKF